VAWVGSMSGLVSGLVPVPPARQRNWVSLSVSTRSSFPYTIFCSTRLPIFPCRFRQRKWSAAADRQRNHDATLWRQGHYILLHYSLSITLLSYLLDLHSNNAASMFKSRCFGVTLFCNMTGVDRFQLSSGSLPALSLIK
jgi:hypothetical protein